MHSIFTDIDDGSGKDLEFELVMLNYYWNYLTILIWRVQ